IEQLSGPECLELLHTTPFLKTFANAACDFARCLGIIEELENKLSRKDAERLALEERVRQARVNKKPRKQIARAEGISEADVDCIIYNKRKSKRRLERFGQTGTLHLD